MISEVWRTPNALPKTINESFHVNWDILSHHHYLKEASCCALHGLTTLNHLFLPPITSPRSSTSSPDLRAEAGKHHRMDAERHSSDEKTSDELGRRNSDDADATFAPINPPATNGDRRERRIQRKRSSASRSLERSWSLNDGTSIGGDGFEEQEADEAGREPEADAGYTVGWDEGDAMNPRSMSKARKWMIVIIVSTGSLCV